ncbi:histidine kinase [bacterium endosymbiont of Escarpia laminata]|nr:MAG: histidine kinase [bacterium endosymbiont of Escarpia laminata]
MNSIKEILDTKGYDVSTIGPEETVLEALKLMAEKELGALVVMEEGKLKGLISERDYARKVILKGRTSLETKVREVMTQEVVCATLSRTADEVMAVMTEKRVRHLPIIDEEQVVGLVSIGDLVKAIISDQQFVIEQLEKYITS